MTIKFLKNAGLMSAVLLGGSLMVAPAFANIQETCEASMTAEGAEDISGCACLQEGVAGNAALEEELIGLDDDGPGIDPRIEAAESQEAKDLMTSCFK